MTQKNFYLFLVAHEWNRDNPALGLIKLLNTLGLLSMIGLASIDTHGL